MKFDFRIQCFPQQDLDVVRTERRVPTKDHVGDYSGVTAGWHEKDRKMGVRRDVPSSPDIDRFPMTVFVEDLWGNIAKTTR